MHDFDENRQNGIKDTPAPKYEKTKKKQAQRRAAKETAEQRHFLVNLVLLFQHQNLKAF